VAGAAAYQGVRFDPAPAFLREGAARSDDANPSVVAVTGHAGGPKLRKALSIHAGKLAGRAEEQS